MPIVRSLKTLKTRVASAVSPQLGALKGTPVIYMEDAVTVSDLQPGFPAYAGYYNGTYANLTEMRARFPRAYIVSVSPNGANGAMCIDIEPGDAVPANAPGFWHNSSHGGAVKPWFYGSASWTSSIVNALTSAGIPRSSYFIWSAHYIGAHICGPGTCGYPQADATQYATNNAYDTSIVPTYMVGTGPLPPPQEPTIQEGSTNKAAVDKLRILLDSHNAQLGNADGGPDAFGPTVKKAVQEFQSVNKLAADGIVGPATWGALVNKKSKPIPNPTPAPPVPPVPPTPAPAQLTVSDYVTATISWDVIPGATKYVVLLSQQDGKVTSQVVSTNAAQVSVHREWTYKVTVRADVVGAKAATYSLVV